MTLVNVYCFEKTYIYLGCQYCQFGPVCEINWMEWRDWQPTLWRNNKYFLQQKLSQISFKCKIISWSVFCCYYHNFALTAHWCKRLKNYRYYYNWWKCSRHTVCQFLRRISDNFNGENYSKAVFHSSIEVLVSFPCFTFLRCSEMVMEPNCCQKGNKTRETPTSLLQS